MENFELSPGSLFANRFEIDKPAGSGGMGMVYRARDRYSDELVALKLLRAGIGGPDESERFVREAQLLSELRHPGIVSYVAHGQTADGQRFLAMEWLDGQDLGQHLAQGPLLVRDCLRLFAQVADALAVAHQRGIVHRDLKPTNLFLVGGDVGRVKLLDFGIARRIATAGAMTKTGMVIGTPEYMAPEQARGSRDLTPAADLFSLGCVLFECLTGQPPFVADHIAAVLVRILFEEPRPIHELRPGVPASVTEILGRLLTKDPLQRMADAAALRTALLSLGELPEPALAATMASTSPKFDSFAEKEQSLFSIVLAAAVEEEIGLDATQLGRNGRLPIDRRALLQAVAGLGGSPDFLANGTLVVTVPPLASAQDQATLAARSALLIKEWWPEAVVAMATGRGAVLGRTAVGEVVELAARALKSGSHPSAGKPASGVLIDLLSAKLLEGRFAQLPRPDGALLLHEERGVDASRPLLGKPTPCVGRDAELSSLESQLTAAIEDSEARVVLFTAPPGAGKSRLRHEFLRRVEKRSEPVTVLLGRGDMMSAGAPYGILRAAVQKLCGISGSESLDIQRERLRSRVSQQLAVADCDRVVWFVGEMCNVPFPEEGKPMLQAARQDPKMMRECLRRALLDFLAAECIAAPILLVLDDLHWSDELSVSLLDEALREQAGAPLFLLAFARPEVHETFPRIWQSHKVQTISLKGLSKKACERLIVQVLGKAAAPEAVARAIEQSGGNALFLEELIRAVAAGKTDEQPDTVLAMLQARIGQFETGPRRALHAAAIFGQTFWAGGAAAVLGLPKSTPEFDSWLSMLTEAEFIQPCSVGRLAEDQEFRFRHALVRDAAYSLLGPSDLVTGHRLAGLFLEAAGDQDAATVAEHLDRGGEKARAATLYGRAAEAAMEKCAPERALRWAERGVACGAEGELLGVLYSVESFSCYLRGRFDRALPAAMSALPFLRPGSQAWSYSMTSACLGAAFGPPESQHLFPGLAMQLLAVEPDANTEGVYAEAVSHTLATLINGAPMAQIQQGLQRLQAICDRAESRNPTVHRHFYTSRGRCIRFGAPNPWQLAQDAQAVVKLCDQSGDLRNRHIAVLLERAWAELGDSELAIKKMTSHPPTEELTALYIGKVALAIVLANQGGPDDRRQAVHLAEEALALLGPFPITAIPAHDCLARVFLQQQQLDAAEAAAREACRILAAVPIYFPDARATLIRVLLAQGKPADATVIAEEARAIIKRYGCLGSAEIELRLAIGEAFHAAQDLDTARTELQETLRQIQIRAENIVDPFWKNSYLTRNPYCVRAQQLGQQWGVDVVLAQS